jgi:hypothetical protein
LHCDEITVLKSSRMDRERPRHGCLSEINGGEQDKDWAYCTLKEMVDISRQPEHQAYIAGWMKIDPRVVQLQKDAEFMAERKLTAARGKTYADE